MIGIPDFGLKMSEVSSAHDISHSFRQCRGFSSKAYSNKVDGKVENFRRLEQCEGEAQQMYGNLTDEDVVFIEGKEDELIGRLQQRIGKTKQEIRNLLAKL